MNRRDILRYTALLTGSAVSASLAGAVLSGCSEPREEKTARGQGDATGQTPLHFFTPEQFALVTLLADTLLPRTDSPSASDVKVPATTDSMLGLVFSREDQLAFKANWSKLESYLNRRDFARLETGEREETLRTLELAEEPGLVEAQQGFLALKQQFIAYYLTSEEIGENYLNYLPIPGRYDPCISVDDVNNKAWAV